MQSLRDKFNAKKDFSIPIDKLHGISVSVKIINSNDDSNATYLKIYSRSFHIETMRKPDSIISSSYHMVLLSHRVNSIEEVIDILKNIKFDRMNGCFALTLPPEDEDDLLLNSLYECSHIKISKVCGVCHERTNSYTRCNHYLCLECADKIKKIDDKYTLIQCPKCGSDISYDFNKC